MITSVLAIYMLTTMITPGPCNLTMLYLGAHFGFRGTRKFYMASAVCILIKSLLCGLLNMALANYIPLAVSYLKWAGAAYMLYLGYTMAMSGWKEEVKVAGQQTESTYKSGVILQLLNMKSWISCLSLYAVYVMPNNPSFIDIFVVAVVYTIVMIICSGCWGLFGSAMKKFITKYKKPFGIVMGLSLVYCAVTAVL